MKNIIFDLYYMTEPLAKGVFRGRHIDDFGLTGGLKKLFEQSPSSTALLKFQVSSFDCSSKEKFFPSTYGLFSWSSMM